MSNAGPLLKIQCRLKVDYYFIPMVLIAYGMTVFRLFKRHEKGGRFGNSGIFIEILLFFLLRYTLFISGRFLCKCSFVLQKLFDTVKIILQYMYKICRIFYIIISYNCTGSNILRQMAIGTGYAAQTMPLCP